MKTIDQVLNNKLLLKLDKFLRPFNRWIVIECDLDTGEVQGWYIDKFGKTKTDD